MKYSIRLAVRKYFVLLFLCMITAMHALHAQNIQNHSLHDGVKYSWMFSVGIAGTATPSTFLFPLEIEYTLPLYANPEGIRKQSYLRVSLGNSFTLAHNDTQFQLSLAPLSFLEIAAGVVMRGHYNFANMGFRSLASYSDNYVNPTLTGGVGKDQLGLYSVYDLRFKGDISLVHLEHNLRLTWYHYTPFLKSDAHTYFVDTDPTVYLPVKHDDFLLTNDSAILFRIGENFSVGLHNVLHFVVSSQQLSDRLSVRGSFDMPLKGLDNVWFYAEMYAGFYAHNKHLSLKPSAYIDIGIRSYF